MPRSCQEKFNFIFQPLISNERRLFLMRKATLKKSWFFQSKRGKHCVAKLIATRINDCQSGFLSKKSKSFHSTQKDYLILYLIIWLFDIWFYFSWKESFEMQSEWRKYTYFDFDTQTDIVYTVWNFSKDQPEIFLEMFIL